jgi:enamine deaminase RidA (YjgF/YER057c/UK114 family)
VDRTVSPGGGGDGSPHELVNPEGLPAAAGFSHAVVPAPGRTVYLGGQAGHREDGTLAGDTLVEQFDQALANVVEALAAAGGRPEHLVSMQILVTDPAEYRASLKELGRAWRGHLGRHYPAIALMGVTELFDPGAMVELIGVAVIHER